MAGGVDGDIRKPWPGGSDSVYILRSNNLNIAGAVSAQKFGEFSVPFACKCVKAEFTAKVFTDADAGGDVTFTVEDDTAGTSKKFVNGASAGASWAAGSCVARALTVDKSVEILAGALLRFSVTSEASDVITDGCVTLHLVPSK